MELRKRIRTWWRRWVGLTAMDRLLLKEYERGQKFVSQRDEAFRLASARTVLHSRDLAADTQRRMAWLEAVNAIRQTQDTTGVMLANLLEIHAMIGCRLDALVEEICPTVAGGKSQEKKDLIDSIDPVDGQPPP